MTRRQQINPMQKYNTAFFVAFAFSIFLSLEGIDCVLATAALIKVLLPPLVELVAFFEKDVVRLGRINSLFVPLWCIILLFVSPYTRMLVLKRMFVAVSSSFSSLNCERYFLRLGLLGRAAVMVIPWHFLHESKKSQAFKIWAQQAPYGYETWSKTESWSNACKSATK